MSLVVQSGGLATTLKASDTVQMTQYIGAGAIDLLAYGSLVDPDTIYREQRAVRTVVNFIAHNAASVGLHAFKLDADDERTRVKTGGAGATVESPDRIATHYEYQRDLFKDVLLWEKFAALKQRAPDGGLELIRIPPRLFEFDRSGAGRPIGLVLDGETFPLDGFLWLDGYPASAKAPMAHLSDLLLEEAQSAKFRANLWARGAQVGGVIERPADAPDWSPKARKSFRELLASKYTGASAADPGGTMLLEDGMSYKSLDHMSSRDAQQIEARKLSTSEVAAAYQVPPVFVGVLDNANYSNVQAYRGMLYSDVLGPLFQQSQQAWTLRVGKELAGVSFFEHNVYEKLTLSFEEQATILQSAVGAPFMTRAEARKRVNLPFMNGTDLLIEPLNVSTGEEEEEETEEPVPETPGDELEGSNTPPETEDEESNQ